MLMSSSCFISTQRERLRVVCPGCGPARGSKDVLVFDSVLRGIDQVFAKPHQTVMMDSLARLYLIGRKVTSCAESSWVQKNQWHQEGDRGDLV